MTMDVGLEMAPKGGPCLSPMGTYEHEFYIPGFFNLAMTTIDGRRIMLTFNSEEELSVLDWTKPDRPFRVEGSYVSPVALSTGNSAMTVVGNHLYITNPAETTLLPGHFYVFDISDVLNYNVSLIGSISSMVLSPFQFDLITDTTIFAYRASGTGGFVCTIDASNPAVPVIADSVATIVMDIDVIRPSTGGVYGVSLNQSLNRLEVWDLNDIYNVSQIFAGLTGISSSITSRIMAKVDNYIYVYNALALTLFVVDMSVPSNPQIVNSILFSGIGGVGTYTGVAVDSDPIKYVGGGLPGHIAVRDFSDPINPILSQQPIDHEAIAELDFQFNPPISDIPSVGPFLLDPQGKTMIVEPTNRDSMLVALDTSCMFSKRQSWRVRELPTQPNLHLNDPVPEMGEPVILYDTRNHEHGDETFLFNEGTGGDVWDLPMEPFTPGDPSDGYGAVKKLNWYSHIPPTIGTNFATSWDDLGGDPCSAPVTFMVALPIPSSVAESELGGGQQDAEVLWDINFVDKTTIGHNFELVLAAYDDTTFFDGFVETAGRSIGDIGEEAGTFIGFYPDDEYIVPVGNILYVETIDFRRQTTDIWIVRSGSEDHEVSEGPGIQVTEPDHYFITYPGNPYCEYDSMGEGIGHMFWHVGFHDGSPRAPGEGWSNVWGAIYAHGTPTADQRRQWWNYFFS